MTPAEQTARAVLAAASLVDPRIREPDPAVIRAWAAILGDIDPRYALAAVKAHYTTETRPIMPADILTAPTLGTDPERLPSARPLAEFVAALPAADPAVNERGRAAARAALNGPRRPSPPPHDRS